MLKLLSGPVAASLVTLSALPALARTAEMPAPDAFVQAKTGAEYRIGPQDVIEIYVSDVAELSRQVTVDTSGKVLLPLVGQLQASGRTPAELSGDIADALKTSYMRDPHVIVSIKESQGQKITVDGAVAQPGVYSLNGPTTLMQAVSLARGADPHFANLHRVAVFRTVDGQRRSAVYDLAGIRRGDAPDPRVYGSDIIMVDTSGAKSFFQTFAGGFSLLGQLVRPW